MVSTVCTGKDLLEFKEEEVIVEDQELSKSATEELSIITTTHDLELTKEEWNATVTIIPGLSASDVHSEGPRQSELISFNEALQFFQTSNMQEQSKRTMPVINRSGLAVFLRCLCGPPRLYGDLDDERDLIFNIAACALENGLPIHMRVLQTIYRQLTSSRFDCPRYGRHWEDIGFQGCDPATDLRGVGFWGLMNLLYMVTSPQTLPLAKNIYQLSLHEIQNFPFVVMSINVTAIAMQVVREERLNRACNSRRQVIAVVNEFYVGLFLYVYLRWKNERKTISHSGFILKDVEAHARSKTKIVFTDLEAYLKNSKTESAESTNPLGDARFVRTSHQALAATDLYSVCVSDCDVRGNGHHALTLSVDNEQNSTAVARPNHNPLNSAGDTTQCVEEEFFI